MMTFSLQIFKVWNAFNWRKPKRNRLRKAFRNFVLVFWCKNWPCWWSLVKSFFFSFFAFFFLRKCRFGLKSRGNVRSLPSRPNTDFHQLIVHKSYCYLFMCFIISFFSISFLAASVLLTSVRVSFDEQKHSIHQRLDTWRLSVPV